MQTPVTREICDKNVKSMTEKIDKLSDNLTKFEITVIKEIANMPDILEKKFDDRYAEKHTESEVDKIQGNMSRLMWIVITGVVIGVLNLVIK